MKGSGDAWDIIRYTGSAPHLYCKTISRRVTVSEVIEAVQKRGTYVKITCPKGLDVTAKYLLPRLPRLDAEKANAVLKFANFVGLNL